MKKLLTDYNIHELAEIMKGLGEKPFRAKQFFEWGAKGAKYSEMKNVPQELLFKLASEYSARGVEIESYAVSKIDGTRKYIFRLEDGDIVEGVLMRYTYGNTMCVSTQVGCRMDCSFCASGLNGLGRNLSPGEMYGQVVAVNRQIMSEYRRAKEAGKPVKEMTRGISNVVLMGSGEPLDNYDNVLKFLFLLNSPDGLNISPRNITLSTCGLPEGIKKLADDSININLTISLHASNDEARKRIMPVAKAHTISDLIDAAMYYFRKSGRRVTYEYALIAGINDSKEDAEELAELVRGLPCHINIINLNPVRERGLRRSDAMTSKQFLEVLQMKGVAVTVRRSLGNDIEGACGQLRNKIIGEKVQQANVVEDEKQVKGNYVYGDDGYADYVPGESEKKEEAVEETVREAVEEIIEQVEEVIGEDINEDVANKIQDSVIELGGAESNPYMPDFKIPETETNVIYDDEYADVEYEAAQMRAELEAKRRAEEERRAEELRAEMERRMREEEQARREAEEAAAAAERERNTVAEIVSEEVESFEPVAAEEINDIVKGNANDADIDEDDLKAFIEAQQKAAAEARKKGN